MPFAKLRQSAMVGMFAGRQVPKPYIFVGLCRDLVRAVAPDAVAVERTCTITLAFKNARMSSGTRLSSTRLAICPISLS